MTLWEPLSLGTLRLRNRIMVPTHAAGAGRILGSEREAAQFIAYYARRAAGGAAWIGGSSTFLRTPLIPGYEPSGVGAVVRGSYRHPLFVERHARYVEALHAEGAVATLQMIIQGGLPHGASAAVSGFVSQDVPHPLSRLEIAEIVAEYGWSAARALEAGVDGLELHANHDDLLQFFLSPLSNRREDEYGADRLRFLLEALGAIRDAVGSSLTLGVRLCMDEQIEGGYGFDDALAMASRLDGVVDYLHVDVGNNWGAPSYVQPMQYDAEPWMRMARRVRSAVSVPVVYTGRVTDAAVAARVIDEGCADVVGMARAVIADPDLPLRAVVGRPVRPCVGGNECLHRTMVDGMRFSCAVNPAAGHELAPVEPASPPRRVLVVGGGPAGLETAALAAERGHDVTLWEREDALGGALSIAALAPHHERFGEYIAFQAARVAAGGAGAARDANDRRRAVAIELGRSATADDVVAFGADVVVLATGARARTPDVPGVERAVQLRDILRGAAFGERVLLVVAEDHAAPLLGAAFLAARGADLRIVYPGPQLAPLVGRYSIGGYVEPLFRAGARFIPMHRLVSVEPLVTADVYAGTCTEHGDVDTVVLACGSEPRTELHAELTGRVPELHLVGDAWAPRRLTIATRQAFELARAL